MPPYKQEQHQSLMSLSMKTTVAMIYSSAVNMNSKSEYIRSAIYNHTLDIADIYTVQGYLLKTLPPLLWDLLFNAVKCFASSLNPRSVSSGVYEIMYFIFVHEKSRKMIFRDGYYTQVISSWSPHFLELRNVVELDLSKNYFSDKSSTKWLFSMVGKVCSKLENLKIVSNRMCDDILSLAGCKEMRSIIYTTSHFGPVVDKEPDSLNEQHFAAKLALEQFPHLEHYSYFHMGEVLASMENVGNLELRDATEIKCSDLHINNIVALCPHLQSLNIDVCKWNYDSKFIFDALASSSLEIQDISISFTSNVETTEVAMKNFFKTKGRFLRKLKIMCRKIFPHGIIQAIAIFCSNLTHLTIHVPTSLEHADNWNSVKDLTTLTKLEYCKLATINPSDLYRLSKMLPLNSTNLTSLDIVPHCKSKNLFISGSLMELIDTTHMPNLSRLHIKRACRLSEKVFRGFYENCPQLTIMDLDRSFVDDADGKYLASIHQGAKRDNLNFKVEGQFLYRILSQSTQ